MIKRIRLNAGAVWLLLSAPLAQAQSPTEPVVAPRSANPFQMAPLSADAPQPSTDRRNLRGYYFMRSSGGLLPGIRKEEPSFTAAGLAVFRERIADREAGHTPDDPQVQCRPMNAVRIFGSGFPELQIIQVPYQITFLLMEDHIVRRIFLNMQHPKRLTPTASGHSIGHWEADSLMVDTVGFKDGGWLDETGTPGDHNEHMIERIRKVDGGRTIEDQVTVEDSTLFTMTITFTRTFIWNPEAPWDEIICEEGNRDALEVAQPSAGHVPP